MPQGLIQSDRYARNPAVQNMVAVTRHVKEIVCEELNVARIVCRTLRKRSRDTMIELCFRRLEACLVFLWHGLPDHSLGDFDDSAQFRLDSNRWRVTIRRADSGSRREPLRNNRMGR